jgi:thiamine-phosphate pyrophosphorylase
MTDERMGDRLWHAIARLPAGAGIVFRHYSLSPPERERLAHAVADAVRERGFTLAIAADVKLARPVGAELVHNPATAPGLPFSRAVHSIEEAEAARAQGAALVFVSPVHATRSHPEREPLGLELAVKIARTAGVPAIALGGVNAQNFARLEREGFYGWAGIDAWL